MAGEPKEKWLNYVALTTIILAVCATLSTFKGAANSTRSVLSQTQAANQWAYYQAKSIKGYLYEIQIESLDLEMKKSTASASKSFTGEYEKKKALYKQKIKKYDEEKADIVKEAKRWEVQRDDAQEHAGIFGIAVIFLQIAILLSSIAALMKKKSIWIFGTALGAVGLVYFANGFVRFF
jgi:hypothetical protein